MEPVNATLGGDCAAKGHGSEDRGTRGGEGAGGGGGYSVGRLVDCAVALPGDPSVSRRHASLVCVAGSWLVEDLGSRSGTFLNGVQLPARGPTPIRTGDLLRIGCYEFLLTVIGGTRVGGGLGSGKGTGRGVRTMATVDDRRTAASRIEHLDSSVLSGGGVAAHRLSLLTAAMGLFASAQDEESLSREAVRLAVEGCGDGGKTGGGREGADLRGALVCPALESGDASGLQVIASLGMDGRDESGVGGAMSRSLVSAAMSGKLAKLSGGPDGVGEGGAVAGGASIAELGISSALAAPVLVGERVVACLYIDRRGRSTRRMEIGDEAAAFVDAVAKVLGLSLAEMHRRDLEQRQLVMHAELEAAHQVQQFLLPGAGRETIVCGGYEVALAVLPGRYVAGDMVEVVRLGDERVAVALGDATGHGIGPAMLIATVQSQLSALLQAGLSASEVVTRINRYLCPRVEGGRFVSLWLGVFGPGGVVEIVDAGHGHALMQDEGDSGEHGGGARVLRGAGGGGVPLGIDDGFAYTAERIVMREGSRVVLYSDGVIEQRTDGGRGEPFGVSGLVASLRETGVEATAQRVVSGVTESLRTAIGGAGLELSDDATVAVVQRLRS